MCYNDAFSYKRIIVDKILEKFYIIFFKFHFKNCIKKKSKIKDAVARATHSLLPHEKLVSLEAFKLVNCNPKFSNVLKKM